MAKTRATKKACISPDTVLTPDFISRAMESNPVEILNNEMLKLEYLFGADPLNEFKAYHSPYNKDTLQTLVRNSYGKTWSRVLMAIALRQDIPECHALHYAVQVQNKKLVRNIVKSREGWDDWDKLYGLYKTSMSTSNSEHVLRFYSSGEYLPLLQFYQRLAATEDQFWGAFKSYVAKVPNVKWRSSSYHVPFKTIEKYSDRILHPKSHETMAAYILYLNNFNNGGVVREVFISLYKHLMEKLSLGKITRQEVFEKLMSWVLYVGTSMEVLKPRCLEDPSSLPRFISLNIWNDHKTDFELALEGILYGEYKSSGGRSKKTSTAIQAAVVKNHNWIRRHSAFKSFFEQRSLSRLIF